MAKRLVSVWLTLTVLLFSFLSVSIYAYADSESVEAEYYLKNVNINGEKIVNYKLSDPIVTWNGSTYVPMNETMGHLLGIEAAMDDTSRTVYITPVTPETVDFDSMESGTSLDSVVMTTQPDITVSVVTESSPNGIRADLTNRPVLMKNSTVYVPIRAIADVLGWSIYWNADSGIAVSTYADVSAESFAETQSTNYTAGLVSYIRKKNPNVSAADAKKMVEYFQLYGGMYGVEPEILMAVAEAESTFYTNIKNSYGCYGLMQIKASTGAAYGFSTSDLLQMKPSIQMASILLGREFTVFNGDKVKALSAYNYGEYAVKRGKYKTGYYNKIIKKYNNIKSYASSYQA